MNTTLKRVISLMLCFVLMAGILPVGAMAAEGEETVATESTEATREATEPAASEEPSESEGDTAPSEEVTESIEEVTEPAGEKIASYGLTRAADYLDAAIFCSDVHGSTSDLTSVLGGVKTSGVDYSSIGFVGDTCLTVANTTSIVQSALGDTDIDVMFSYAKSHDTENGADIANNWNYSGEVEGVSDYYLVYTIRETDMQNSSDAATAAPAFTSWYNGLSEAEKALPIFIISHRPLHDRRDDNAGAATWYSAISAAAESSDIVFFWGHNHTGDGSVDQAAYYVAKDGTETFTVYNGSTVVPNFTYMNAGYINANNQKPARLGVATTVQITADSLVFQDYNSSGAYTGTYAHNVTVAREFAATEPEATLSSIAISGTTEYYVGDELKLTVTATYDDGTTADVTAKATFNNDLSASGAYTVTATYTEGDVTKTASTDVTVYIYAEDENSLIGVEVFSQGATGLTVTWDDAAEAYLDGVMDDYVVYDLALTNAGETAEYAMTIVDDMDTSALVVYHVAEDGTLTEMDFAVEGDCVVFTTSLTGTFAYGTVSIPSGYELDSLMVTNPRADYLVGQKLDTAGEFAVQAVYTKEGAEDFVRTLYVYEANNNPDGYELNMDSFDMTAAGSYNVEITYGGKSATFPITVWGDEFTASDVTVALDAEGAEYGVTAVNVSESANEHVASAVADVIKEGYVAYDITLAYTEGYEATEDTKTVTLPIPEGVTNPVVYYVSDNGATVTNMNATNNGDGTVTFTTTHFSTYVVGESTEITVPDPETATGSGSTTTTTKKTVYVLTSSISAGNDYLIVNGNSAGSYYALANNNGSVAATGVTVKTDSKIGTYIELDDATDELWTVSNSYRFQNNGYYLRYNNGLGLSTSNYTTWSYSSNRLSYRSSRTTYYLRYNNGWTTTSSSSSATSIYFYIPTEIDVETTTTVSGTYSIAGNPAEVTATVIPGATMALGSTLTFTPTSGTATTTDTSTTATYTVVDGGDPNGVISGINGNTVTFTGNTGKALVKVTYTTQFGDVSNYILITAVKRDYKLTIGITEGDTTTPAESAMNVKQGAVLNLSGTAVTYVDGNGVTQTVSDADITWTLSGDGVKIENGIVTVDEDVAGQEVELTATWTDPYGNTITDTLKLTIVDAVWALDLCEPTYTQATEYVEGTTYFTLTDGVYTAATGVTEDNFADGTYYTQATTSITAPIVIKDVTDGQTYTNVWAVITKDGVDQGALDEEELANLTFVSSNTSIATVDSKTGVVTFQGGEGIVVITAVYKYGTTEDGEEKSVTDSVIFSVSKDHYYVPEDGTNDFPEYPNEGAIRFDKNATAVGHFSETGITKVELSMTGVPITTSNAMDVVVMLDMTGSMSDNGIAAAEAAAKAFIETIVKNKDGSYNNNRVAVYQFNSEGITTYFDLQTISSDSELTAAQNKINGDQASGGTPFDEAAEKCHDVLEAAKTDGIGNDRQQFCVFMSDGGPTSYEGSDGYTYYAGNNTSGDRALTSYIGGYTSSTASSWTYNLPTEYWTDHMKADGVTVYTVGLLLQNAPSNPSPYSSMTDSTYDSTTDSLTTIGSHYYFCSTILRNMASDASKYIDIFSVDNADNATAKFQAIAQAILEAATDVKVVDKITDEYTMVFDIPNAGVAEALEGTDYEKFYIEVIDYALTPVYANDGETITDYVRGNATSKLKLYLGQNSDGSYYAASDADGTEFADPTFNQTAVGSMFYWTTTDISGQDDYSGISVTVSGTTYYFDPAGMSNKSSSWNDTVAASWYNMASGAYAYGTPTTITITDSDSGETTESTTCENLIIATPYFVYNATSKMLTWTAEKLSSSELALSYFLYLENSGGFAGAAGENKEIPAGTYETNEYAYLTYTNFNGKECEQEFPVPQMTWNGAQVSYVFYLVNEQGQPVNRAGKVVPFSEAVYVTDVYTYSIIWNKLEQSAGLEAERLAEDLVPEVYELYDKDAVYRIHVYENEQYVNLNNHFTIESGKSTYTTYVFNTKADAIKYTAPGTYVANNGEGTDSQTNLTYLCKGDGTVTATVVDGVITAASYTPAAGETQISYESLTTKTGATNIGGYAYYLDDNGEVYTIVQKANGIEAYSGFDFSNTTVAFAVVWKPELVPDTVVIDYGLDVVIDVTTNDALASGVVGVRADAPSGIEINKGTYAAAKTITTDIALNGVKIGTASVDSLTSVRFALDKDNGMLFSEPVEFFYESDVNYYVDGQLTTTSMYSSVTVIPATTIYYEDSFVDLEVYTDADDKLFWKDSEGNSDTDRREWEVVGTTINATQAQDRPGQSQISATLDADNNYGYDGAYTNLSTYSMGSARMLTVDPEYFGKVKFDFCGTGFDVISMTSNATGTIVVQVFDASGTSVRSIMVDTYYGYVLKDDEWVLSNNDPNALYQVPVITVEGLDYGTYSVVITAAYNEFLDHAEDGSYDLYLDAIRIYDPTGNENETANNAYVADGEGWPSYTELRDNIIEGTKFKVVVNEDGSYTVTTVEGDTELGGAIFIDSNDDATLIADYVSYGPNNELYLDNGQAVAFNVDTTNVADVQLGIKSATGAEVTYKINGVSYTVDTAADMYYSILKQAQAGTVIIENVSGGILSLTTIKVTYPSNPGDVNAANVLSIDEESAAFALMSLRRAPVVETEPTEPEVTEPTVPETETTAPETEETQPETETTAPETEETQPETEATQPETEDTQPETEETQPEVEPSEPEEDDSDVGSKVEETIRTIGKIIRKLLGWLFG